MEPVTIASASPVAHHAGAEHVAVLVHQALAVTQQETLALAFGVEELGIAAVESDRRALWISMPSGSGMPSAAATALMRSSRPDQHRRAVARIAEGDGGADHLLLLALGKHHALGVLADGFGNRLQRADRRIEPVRQVARVSLQIDQRLARYAAVHRRLGDSRRDARDQPRIEGVGDDVVGTETQRHARPRAGHFLGHILARQHRQRLGGGDLHRVVDGGSAHVERATEDEGEAEDVVHLVGVVRPPRRDDAVRPRGTGFIGRDLRHLAVRLETFSSL